MEKIIEVWMPKDEDFSAFKLLVDDGEVQTIFLPELHIDKGKRHDWEASSWPPKKITITITC